MSCNISIRYGEFSAIILGFLILITAVVLSFTIDPNLSEGKVTHLINY